jgi:DNA-binding Lrp family transcriptional regulator
MLKISAESGISRRTLHRSKKELEEKGYLKATKLYGHRSYIYNLDGLWKRVRELIDIDKEQLYQTKKLKKEKYEEYKNYSSLEDSHLVERQNGTD